MTASPYHQGTNDKASDKALYKMEGELEVKLPHKIELEKPQLNLVQPQGKAELIAEAEEKLTHINSSYTLNDYFLPRGFANLYVSGVGTKDSTGFMTNGDYQQIEAYKMSSIGLTAVAVPLLITRASVKSRLIGQTEKLLQQDFPI